MKTKTLQVFLGFDSRTAIAYETARASIARRTSLPISIVPLRLAHLSEILARPIENRGGQLWCPISDAPMSTEFAISRFCIPFLQPTGWALFADCDIICHSDISDIFAHCDDRYAVMVVKHRHESDPVAAVYDRRTSSGSPGAHRAPLQKMDGQIQTYYSRKNWSSVVLWNCAHSANKRFTLEHLNKWPGRDLHAFKWLKEDEIGELPQHWNWLINVTPGEPEKRGLWHYTLGGPWFKDWPPAKYDDEWIAAAGGSAAPRAMTETT